MGASGVVICSAADQGFFSLLRDLVISLQQRGMAALEKTAALGVLDLGLTQEQRLWLSQRGVVVVSPGWDVDFPKRAEQPEHFRSQIARAFLPRHFPGYRVYVWLDADTWVQDGAVLRWLVDSARKGGMALCEEHHPAYNKVHDQKELSQKAWLIQTLYGKEDAERYGLTPSLNSGVFALRYDAPHWAAWGQEISDLLQRVVVRFVDQMALERIIHHHGHPATYFPARANWIVSQAVPSFCADRGLFVDPLPPHDSLWVLHLALGAKDLDFFVPFLDGRSMVTGLRLSSVAALVGLDSETESMR